ncbi:LptF/LptG family permease [Synechocystis salina LEGE 06099]|nr:LptF/LptG family permease [Synechocystis salina LEGE 06099]
MMFLSKTLTSLGQWPHPLPRISLMDRYVARQLIPPFLFSVGVVASLGLAIGNLSDLGNKIVEKNLPVAKAAEVLLLKVPEFLAYSLPVAVMLATMMAFGRLSGDSEIIAIRSCGVSLYRLVLPAVVLSLLVTGWAFVLSEWVVPVANYRATSILIESIDEEHPFWQNRDVFYPEFEEIKLENGQTARRLKSLVYAEKFDGKEMQNLTVLQWTENHLKHIVLSDNATWNNDNKGWDFFHGTVYRLTETEDYQEAIPFTNKQIALPKSAFDFARQGRDPYEMTIAEAQDYIKILKLIGDEKKIQFFQVRTEQKLAFPFVCIVFAVVGSAIGARPQRISRATGFGLTIVIIFAYYILGFFSGSLGIVGLISPTLAAWLPNFVGLGVGIWLLYEFLRQ